MNIDFERYLRTRAPGKKSDFGKALGVHLGYRHVVDGTCGLAQDATFMARLGFEVLAIERSRKMFDEVTAAFLKAHENPLDHAVLGRLTFRYGDSMDILKDLKMPIDVIYLDPMFDLPGRTSEPRKEIQELKKLVGSDADQLHLFNVAREINPKRIVLKRKRKSPRTEYPLPDHSFRGQKIRYDIYLQKT